MSTARDLQAPGRNGFKYCPAGQTIEGDFDFLMPDGSSTFSAVCDGSDHPDIDDLVALERNYGVPGHFTSVTNTSGDPVLCFHRVKPE